MNPTLLASLFLAIPLFAQDIPRSEVAAAMRKAATFFHDKVAAHSGYVYYYSPDLTRRLGEGKASPTQIWVQRPGTPAVGMAFLKTHAATGDPFYLDCARESAEALVHGQLQSGGWTNSIDFDPSRAGSALYPNGKGKGRNMSSLDDGITQGALSFLMHADRALGFQHKRIHEAALFALEALIAAQFDSGGFPQGWVEPAATHPPVQARYPDYDWKTENRIKNYWDMPTLNDGLAGTVAQTLTDGWNVYADERCKHALVKLGDFLLLARMPAPQPAWAQQYDHQMRPIWARKFEPPAIAGRESQDALETLLLIHRTTRNAKYLEPLAESLAYLQRSLLPDGSLARYYELETNKPLYMTSEYNLTYDDKDLPQHYGWKTSSHIPKIEKALVLAKSNSADKARNIEARKVREILATLDEQGRWVTIFKGQPLVGQPKFKHGEAFISSEVFSENLEALSDYLSQ